MSDIEALQDAFLKADALAQQGDAQAQKDAKMFADEILALQQRGGGKSDKPGALQNFNRGVANTLDAVSPFNTIRRGINSAFGTDLPTDLSYNDGFRDIGIRTAQGEPEGLVNNFARGSGEAAAALPFITAGAGLVSGGARAGSVTANVADDIYRGLATKSAAVAEPIAGGIARMAGQATEDAGYPRARPFVEAAAPLAAGGALIGAGRLAGAGLRGSERLPLTGAAVRTARQAIGAIGPMTGAGARQQAREQLVREAGSEDRAAELGNMIKPETEIGLTPAQQTGDENLLALERAAAAEQPQIRESLAARDAASRARAQEGITEGSGQVSDARDFFNTRLSDFKTSLDEQIDTVVQMGDEGVQGVGPRVSESTASERMTQRLKGALDEAKENERALWARVSRDETVPTTQSWETARRIFAETPDTQDDDIPAQLGRFFSEGGFGDEVSVARMHGLYSKLREVSRTARAGNNQQRNKARIADEMADAILNDLGAVPANTPVGRQINEARAYSAAMHEKFDQGTVGRILNRSIDGDETIPAASALKRTVGRGGSDALVDSRNIRAAANEAGEDVAEYLRGRFVDSVITPDGEFSRKTATRWLRNNRELMSEYPELVNEFGRALSNRQKAETFVARTKVRADAADDTSIGKFTLGQEQKAVSSILTADSPSKAARNIVATARKDKTGKALAGVKAAFTDYMIGNATKGGNLTGKDVVALLGDGQTKAAMQQVFSPAEMGRMNRIAQELAKLDAAKAATPKGPVMDSPPAMLIDTVARIAGAKAGAKVGGGGGAGVNLQAAQLGSSRARDIVSRLTNDKARRILYDAIEDPALMRALLLEPKGTELPQWAASKITPYLTGAATQSVPE